MKKLIYLIYLFPILLWTACQGNTSEINPMIPQENAREVSFDSLSERITMEELPATIKEVINKEELFTGLHISNIQKITENDFTYYDMTFKDVDGQLIMVFYDEQGQIIVP